MAGVAKAVLVAMLAGTVILLLTQVAAFLPFYMSLVVTTSSLANAVAVDNYLHETLYEDTLAELQARPLFSKLSDRVEIEVENGTGFNSGSDTPDDYSMIEGEAGKPYKQRGEPINVTVSAAYPLEMTVWGNTITMEVPVTYSITTVGLRYYKDLDMP
jgi:hypothetical protein